MHQLYTDLSLIYVCADNASLLYKNQLMPCFLRIVLVYKNHLTSTKQILHHDGRIGSQWFLTKIQAFSCMGHAQGDTSVVIGIVDSGTDWDHPDLQNNINTIIPTLLMVWMMTMTDTLIITVAGI